MIVLHKKRIIICAYAVFISLFTIFYSMANYSQKSIETMALPVSNKVVTLDAGHGLPDKRSYTDQMIATKVKLILK